MARLERKPAERVAILGIIFQVIAGALAFLFWRLSNAATTAVLIWQALIGIIVWIIALVDLRQNRMADEEKLDWERLQAEREAGGARGRLFEEDEIQAFSARNRLKILEKWIIPTITFVVAALLLIAVLAIFFQDTISMTRVVTGKKVLVSVAGLFGTMFVLFLISTYAAGLSQQQEWRPLRGASSFMMFTTLLIGACVVALGLGYFEFYKPDRIIAYVMLALLALVAIEFLLNMILDFYRPRVEGVENRVSYDSRLLGLIAQPTGVLNTVSSTLDYQFGFKVSQTWFYQFVEQAIAPLILFQLITLYLLTCFVIIGPEQQGVLERFGKFKEPVNPGLVVKLPWPFDRVYRFPANEVKTIYLGRQDDEKEKTGPILWTVKHYEKEYNVMVAVRDMENATPATDAPVVNLLSATATVRYAINNVQKWYYSSSDSAKLLHALCEREQTKYLAQVDLFDVMGPGRNAAAVELQRAMQAAADKEDIGVTILGVGVEGIHPPVEEGLPDAFHQLVTAVTDKEIAMLAAESARITTVSEAQSAAQNLIAEARGYYATRVNLAEAEAKRFQTQNTAYTKAEEVFRAREYLDSLQSALKTARKYVIGVQKQDREVLRLNLEDPVSPDITDIGKFKETVVPK